LVVLGFASRELMVVHLRQELHASRRKPLVSLIVLLQALSAGGLSQHLQLRLLHDQQHLFLERRDLLVQVPRARLCQVGQQVGRQRGVLLVLFLEGQQEVLLVLVPVNLCHLLQQLAQRVVRDLEVLCLQHQQLVVRDLEVLCLQHQQLVGPLVGLCPVL